MSESGGVEAGAALAAYSSLQSSAGDAGVGEGNGHHPVVAPPSLPRPPASEQHAADAASVAASAAMVSTADADEILAAAAAAVAAADAAEKEVRDGDLGPAIAAAAHTHPNVDTPPVDAAAPAVVHPAPAPLPDDTEKEVLREDALLERRLRERAEEELERVRALATKSMEIGAKRVRALQQLCAELQGEAVALRERRVADQLTIDELTITLASYKQQQRDASFFHKYKWVEAAWDRGRLAIGVEEADARSTLRDIAILGRPPPGRGKARTAVG